jgi:glyoxylase-like metal-dependent hydrolase (beta-lactamase superfamily II)
MQLFQSEKAQPGITRICGFAGEFMHLIEGSQSAVLIDSGCGIGNVKECTDALTKKQLKVLLTHGHIDHAAGAYLYGEVYMNPADDALYKQHTNQAFVDDIMRPFLGEERYSEIKDNILPAGTAEYKPLTDGMTFSLGGFTLEIIGARGHTKGSVAILIQEPGILVLGDAANANALVYADYSTTIEEYWESLKELQRKVSGRYVKVYFSHVKGEDEPGYIESAIEVCEDIMSGKSDEIPIRFMNDIALLAKKSDENFVRVDGGLANIVYSKERIWKPKE